MLHLNGVVVVVLLSFHVCLLTFDQGKEVRENRAKERSTEQWQVVGNGI